MAYFDRFDICEAHLAIENDYNSGGWLHERPSNQRRREATHIQLARIGFRAGAAFNGFDSLSDNGKEIYADLQVRYGFANVDSFEVLDHGEDGSQYFPGCGTIPSQFAHVVTGVGDTANEALDDALDSISQNGDTLTALQVQEMRDSLTDADKSAFDSLDHSECGEDHDGDDWNHYVSIRYNIRGEVA